MALRPVYDVKFKPGLAKCGQVPMEKAPIRLQRQQNEQQIYANTSLWRQKVWHSSPFVATSADARHTPFILQDLSTAKISTGVFTAPNLQFMTQNSRQDDSTNGCSTVGSMFEHTRDLNWVGVKWLPVDAIKYGISFLKLHQLMSDTFYLPGLLELQHQLQ